MGTFQIASYAFKCGRNAETEIGISIKAISLKTMIR